MRLLPKIDLDFLKQKKKPLHVAIDGRNLVGWAEKNKKEEKEVIEENSKQIMRLIDYQIKNSIPILTLNLSSESDDEINALTKLVRELVNNEDIHKNKIRFFAIGQWFDLDINFSEALKNLMNETKEYDNQFLNFCINYDGQQEVLGVIRLLAIKAKLGKIDLDKLSKEDVKENLYTSYFTPPEIIIEPSKIYSGLLLWDSKGAKIYQTRKHWLDITSGDVDSAIEWANRE